MFEKTAFLIPRTAVTFLFFILPLIFFGQNFPHIEYCSKMHLHTTLYQCTLHFKADQWKKTNTFLYIGYTTYMYMQCNGNICFGEVVVDIMRFLVKNTSVPASKESDHPLFVPCSVFFSSSGVLVTCGSCHTNTLTCKRAGFCFLLVFILSEFSLCQHSTLLRNIQDWYGIFCFFNIYFVHTYLSM